MIRLGITGTDTGVGKTVVAAALIAGLRSTGRRVAGMKPVETGVSGVPADAALLRDAAGGADCLSDVCPAQFREPLAPLVAAARAQEPVDLPRLDAAFDRLALGRDAIVVEGAGGLLVPITEQLAYDGLFRRWGLDLIVVAANRLGALNHTLLTLRAAWQAGLRVRAVVLNSVCPATESLAACTNLDTLRALLPGSTVVTFPYVEPPHNPAHLAAALPTPLLDTLATDELV